MDNRFSIFKIFQDANGSDVPVENFIRQIFKNDIVLRLEDVCNFLGIELEHFLQMAIYRHLTAVELAQEQMFQKGASYQSLDPVVPPVLEELKA